MSERSAEERAVDDAIEAAVQAANPGSIVTGWVLVLSSTVPEDFDSTAFVYDAPPGQSLAVTLGLLDIGRIHHRRRMGDAE